MPNIKSSIRSVKTDAERRAKNAPIKAAIRNAARKVVAVIKLLVKVLSIRMLQTAKNQDLLKKSMLWTNLYSD